MWETEQRGREAIDENYQGKLPNRYLLTTLSAIRAPSLIVICLQHFRGQMYEQGKK